MGGFGGSVSSVVNGMGNGEGCLGRLKSIHDVGKDKVLITLLGLELKHDCDLSARFYG